MSGTRSDPSFIIHGNRNWKECPNSFRKHASSEFHKTSYIHWIQGQRMQTAGDSVAQQLSRQYRKEVQENRRNVRKLLEIVQLFCKQNIPFRGHNESEQSSNRGNYLEILHWIAKDSPELKRHLEKSFHYTSPESQNEMIQLLGLNVQKQIIMELKEAGPYALIADETMDISRKEQFSICVRYVTGQLQVQERFLGFWDVATTDGETLCLKIQEILSQLGINLNMLRAQAYDGASNMRGRYSGVATRIKELEPRAIYIHCYCHLLNLSLQDSCTSDHLIRNTLGSVNALYDFLEASAKRHSKFEVVQKAINTAKPPTTLKHLCETRWASRYRAVHAVKDLYDAVIKVLQDIEQEDGKAGADAASLLKSISTFSFFFIVLCLDAVFSVINILSQYLQEKTMTFSRARTCTKSILSTLSQFRNDQKFESLWKVASEKQAQLELEPPTLLRHRRIPRRIDGEAENEQYSSVDAYFRKSYYSMLDF